MSENDVRKAVGSSIVIESVPSVTGAESIAPETQGRGGGAEAPQYVPGKAVIDPALQLQVETFLYRQAAILDAKNWQGFIDLFTDDGVYWMPAHMGQTSYESEPSIFAEDTLLMEIRMGRLLHPNAWSQAPMWGTSHLVGNVVIEQADGDRIRVASRFQMMELRRDAVRHFAGTYRHVLRGHGDDLRIEHQRVDLMNGQAAYDYVIQAWV